MANDSHNVRNIIILHMVLVVMTGLSGCAHDAIDYIPPTDRAFLQAQARAAAAPGRDATSVDAMLGRARAPSSAAASLVLQFDTAAVAPDDGQRQTLAGFAAKAQGQPVTVVSRPAELNGPAALLGQRRALAVARALQASLPDVLVRFSPDAPADAVLVSLGGAP